MASDYRSMNWFQYSAVPNHSRYNNLYRIVFCEMEDGSKMLFCLKRELAEVAGRSVPTEVILE
jgi:hypothetical protein